MEKIRGKSAPKHAGAETKWIGSLGPRMFWGTRATNFAIYMTKMEGAGPQILSTGAKFKRVLCQKRLSCKPGKINISITTQMDSAFGARRLVGS